MFLPSDSSTPFNTTSTAPQPGTSSGGSTFDDFINSVVRGTVQVINAVKPPQQGPGWGGTQGTYVSGSGGNSSLLGFGLIAVLLFLVIKG